jgi:hypothetical protein
LIAPPRAPEISATGRWSGSDGTAKPRDLAGVASCRLGGNLPGTAHTHSPTHSQPVPVCILHSAQCRFVLCAVSICAAEGDRERSDRNAPEKDLCGSAAGIVSAACCVLRAAACCCVLLPLGAPEVAMYPEVPPTLRIHGTRRCRWAGQGSPGPGSPPPTRGRRGQKRDRNLPGPLGLLHGAFLLESPEKRCCGSARQGRRANSIRPWHSHLANNYIHGISISRPSCEAMRGDTPPWVGCEFVTSHEETGRPERMMGRRREGRGEERARGLVARLPPLAGRARVAPGTPAGQLPAHRASRLDAGPPLANDKPQLEGQPLLHPPAPLWLAARFARFDASTLRTPVSVSVRGRAVRAATPRPSAKPISFIPISHRHGQQAHPSPLRPATETAVTVVQGC